MAKANASNKQHEHQERCCTGTVLVDKRDGYGQKPFEIVSLYFEDGGAACTVGDILARLGISVKSNDRIMIAVSKLRKTKQ